MEGERKCLEVWWGLTGRGGEVRKARGGEGDGADNEVEDEEAVGMD